jgi:hypothetical protein
MKHNTSILKIALSVLGIALVLSAYCNMQTNIRLDGTTDPTHITRTINGSKTFREFPDLAGYWNTSIQKTPAPVVAKLAEESFGKAQITRCWLNLDEMWDYRTKQYNFDFKIGVDKYKDINEKYRESWNWEEEANVTFYEYLKAFSLHSNELMLTIRRYERDVLDGKLPVTKADWKTIFKTGLKHYKLLYPNIRYIEVGNEYSLKSFMNATDEEYYQFYKLGYEAVNEVNEELSLKGNNRIFVGGPVVTGDILKMTDHFLQLFAADTDKKKQLDFVAWHDYHKKITETANRQQEIQALLKKYNLPVNLPLFITEHDPFHFSEDKPEYHTLNTAYLPKSLYFGSLTSPNVKIFPWVLYHRREIQTKFMWFDGPNDSKTSENQIKMLPLGCSVKFLSMLKGKEVQVNNSIDGDDLVLASVDKGKLAVEAINYGDQRDVTLTIGKLSGIFSGLKDSKVHITKYLIDSKHSNCLTNPDYVGGIEKVDDSWVDFSKGEIVLKCDKLEKNGLVFWVITK